MKSEIVNSKIICPKCKSNNLLLVEVWSQHTITWDQIDGKFDKEDGSLEMGDPYKVEANCKECSHIWKIRKAIQIGYCY